MFIKGRFGTIIFYKNLEISNAFKNKQQEKTFKTCKKTCKSKILKRTEYEEKCKYLTHKHKNITLLPLLFVLNSFNYSILSSNTTPRSEDKIFNFFPIILSFSFSHTGWFAKTTRKSITFSRWSL